MDVNNFVTCNTSKNQIEITGNSGRWTIMSLSDNIIHFVYLPDNAAIESGGSYLEKQDYPITDMKVSINQTLSSVTLSTESLKVKADFRTFGLTIKAVSSNLYFQEDGLCIESKVKANEHEINYTQSILESEEFYGFGLQMKSFAQKGKEKILKTNADPTHDNGFAHAVAPFFVSTSGYGMYFNHSKYPEFDMGSENRKEMEFRTSEGFLDFYFIYGSSVADVIKKYQSLIGMPALPPISGLGLSYRGYIYWDQNQILNIAKEFRNREIPCDYIGLEPGWLEKAGPCSFVWNSERFSEPSEMIDKLHEMGFKFNLWEHGWVSPEAPFFKDILKYCGDQKGMGGFVPDLTIHEAKRIFIDYHRKTLLKMGVDSFKLDECDGSDNTGGWFFPDNTLFPSGLDGSDMHNIFGYLYQKTIHEAYAEINRRTFLQCRGGYDGASKYPTAFYSDLYDFREYLTTAVNSGFTNMLWSPEIRETKDSADFIRRCQLMFFNHYPQVDAWYNGVTPWDLGDKVLSVFRKYAELRMRLIPYLYGCHRIAYETGLPVIRALVVDYSEDIHTHYIDDQYIFGDSIMVAPVYTENTRRIYLPKGQWTDFWTEQRYDGGRTIEYYAPLDRLPMFIKSGGIIPMSSVMQYVGEKAWDPLTLEIYSGKDGSFELYKDDGETLDYTKGKYLKKKISYTESDEGWNVQIGQWKGELEGAEYGRNMIICIHGTEPVESVVYGDKLLESIPFGHFSENQCCWSYDMNKRILEIRIWEIDPNKDISVTACGRIETEVISRRESWRTFYHRLAKAEKRMGKTHQELRTKMDNLWSKGVELTVPLFREQIEESLVETICQIADSSVDEETGKLVEEILEELIPVESFIVLENDRVVPENCRVVVSVSNRYYNPDIKLSVLIENNDGWICENTEEDICLQGGASKNLYYYLQQKAGTQQAFLEVKATLKVMLDNKVLYSKNHTASWGGYVTCWSLLGPFNLSNEHAEFPFRPDKEPDLTKSYSDGEVTLGWEVYSSAGSNNAYIVLDRMVGNGEEGVFYAYCSVFSTVKQEGRIEIGCTGDIKAWWNGCHVMAEQGKAPAAPAQYTSKVDIRPGWNQVLLKIEKNADETGFFFRVAGIWGEALHSLAFSEKVNLTKQGEYSLR